MTSAWEKTAAQKRQETLSLIPQEWIIKNPPSREEQKDVTGEYIHQFLDKKEIEITETDAIGIVENTISGRWSAVDVTKAFCHRAALAHQLTNCLIEIFFEQAIERAQHLDNYFAQNKKPIGPLHGLPVSLKDQFHVKGVETSMGYIGWLGTFQGKKGTGFERQFESELTKELLTLGAVLFVKTSIPHTLMSPESNNHITGYVWGPKNRLLSAGGSSGGEGALVALKGSPLGFGSDIGGSVRIPSATNGLYGLRPSSGRIPYEGAANSMDGQSTVLSVIGPISHSPGSLILALKAVLSQKPWLHDPTCLEIPWRDDQAAGVTQLLNSPGAAGKLAFGVIWEDECGHLYPPVKRAVNQLVETLQKAGHEIVTWKPKPTINELCQIAFQAYVLDGGTDIFDAFKLSGEPAVPQVEVIMGKEPQPEKDASFIHKLNVDKRNAQKAYMEFWNNSVQQTSTGRPVDAIICPTAQTCGCLPLGYGTVNYTIWVNVLDYTSVVVPVTRADKNLDPAYTNFVPFDDADAEVMKLYDPETWHGSPVSLQLVGRRHQEEKILTLAHYVGAVLSSNI